MSDQDRVAQLEAERKFLLWRTLDRHPTLKGWQWIGRSSNALVAYAFGEPEPSERDYPRDWDDLGRCLNTFKALPDHLKERARVVLTKYEEYVQRRDYEREKRVVLAHSVPRD